MSHPGREHQTGLAAIRANHFDDQAGQVGFGFGKANDVPTSVEKGVKEGRKAIRPVALSGATIPHKVVGRFGAAKVIMIPASPGTGVIAGASVPR